MGILEAVKKGFGQTTKLMNVILVFFIFNAIIGLISLPLSDPANAGNAGIITISIISSILFFLIFVFLQGGALGLVKDQIKASSASMSKFVEYGKTYYLKILVLLLLYVLVAIGVVLVLSLISAGILLIGDNIATRSIVATLITVVAIALITLLIYPIYSIIVDNTGAFAALKKGVATAKANFWKTLGLFVTMLVVSLLISLVIGFIIGLVTVPLPVGVSRILIAIVNAAVQSYIPIVMMVAFMSYYISLAGGSEPVQQEEPQQFGSQ